jgi:hypothetical protein
LPRSNPRKWRFRFPCWFFWHHPGRSAKGLAAWVRPFALPSLYAGFLTIVYIIGKSIGAESLLRNPQYQPAFSLRVFLRSNVDFFKELFYLDPNSWLNAQWLLIVWLLLAYIAYRRRENYLKWATLMIVVAPLPIALIPGRDGACLYIPWFGWALWLAALGTACSSYVSREPLLRRLPRDLALAIPLVLIVAVWWRQTDLQNRRVVQGYRQTGAFFQSVAQQLQTLLPKVKPGTQIAYYDDDCYYWDAKFITELLYHDRSVTVRLHSKTPLSPEEFDRMDYVLNIDHGRLAVLKRPGEHFRAPADLTSSQR